MSVETLARMGKIVSKIQIMSGEQFADFLGQCRDYENASQTLGRSDPLEVWEGRNAAGVQFYAVQELTAGAVCVFTQCPRAHGCTLIFRPLTEPEAA